MPRNHREPDPQYELFSILTVDGCATGVRKPRALVHQHGDWHRAFHCWVVRGAHSMSPSILLQRRSMTKDTSPGLLDVAVGGHYRAGESFEEVFREINEELGLAVNLDQLVPVGIRRTASYKGLVIDREIQDVHALAFDGDFATLHPSHEEISAIHLISHDDLLRLFSRERSTILSTAWPVTSCNTLGEPVAVDVSVDDFPQVTDDYWCAGAQAAVAVLRGELRDPLHLW